MSILLYADDIAICAENENDLQQMLTYVHNWCKKWKLKINNSKSKIIHFRKQRTTQSSVKFYNGQTLLETVESYTYLGVLFDQHLNWSKCKK